MNIIKVVIYTYTIIDVLVTVVVVIVCGRRVYRIVPGKCPWAPYHNSLFFTTLGAYLVYWALTMCPNYAQN